VKAPYHVLSDQPLVLISYWDAWADPRNNIPFGNALGDRPCTILLIPMWTKEPLAAIWKTWRICRNYRQAHPRHRIVVLCSTESERRRLGAAGIEGIFCSHNALVDESIFRITSEEKRYDAIYNAQMAPFKRHKLARNVESLALLAYFDGVRSTKEYYFETKRQLRSALWLNEAGDRTPLKRMEVEAVVTALNRARVGLCLSAKEGAMYASIEYMLCGLPIVSTRSRGGRDEFFDDRYVVMVRATADAVRRGVAEAMHRAAPPALVREETLKKIAPHRERFTDFLDSVLIDSGCSPGGAKVFQDGFRNHRIRKQDWSVLKEVAART